MRYCEVCGAPYAEKHHIVFRSRGGLDIDINFKDLCPEHHRGRKSPHKNKQIDLAYKQELQAKLFELFKNKTYQIKEIADIIGYDKNRLEKRFKTVPQHCGEYKPEDIVRCLMGGRLY